MQAFLATKCHAGLFGNWVPCRPFWQLSAMQAFLAIECHVLIVLALLILQPTTRPFEKIYNNNQKNPKTNNNKQTKTPPTKPPQKKTHTQITRKKKVLFCRIFFRRHDWRGITYLASYIKMFVLVKMDQNEWMNEWMFNDTPARKTDRLLGVRKR